MKRPVSILLALLLTLTLAPSALAARNDHTDYSQFPLVKEGEPVTISVVTPRNDQYGKDPDKTWFWIWSETATNLKFDVRQIMSSSLAEQKNLMYAANDLPDLLLGLQTTTGELMRYGVQEGQLLALQDLITEERMPYLYKWLDAYPEAKAFCTTPDGNMYTLPFLGMNSDRVGSQEAIQISKVWLEKAGCEIPETLDDFVDFLYACKALDPECTPVSGLAEDRNPLSMILNALGFITTANNDFGNLVALREGKVVIPAIDPTFAEYLHIVRQFYADGILLKDFFTAPDLAVNTLVTEGKTAIFAGFAYGITPLVEDFQKWTSVKPLTSAWNDKQQWKDSFPYNIGSAELSAQTPHADLILRYLDFFYSELGIFYLWEGPLVGSADTLGMVVGMDFQNKGKYFNDVVNGSYESSLAYVYAVGPGLASRFNRSHSITYPDKYTTMMETLQYCLGIPDDQIDRTPLKYDHGDNYGRICMAENISPYVVEGYPSIVYYDEATQEAIDEITLLLDAHIKSEVAKFITGARDLSEFDQFVSECVDLGAQDLQDMYAQAYQQYLDTLE